MFDVRGPICGWQRVHGADCVREGERVRVYVPACILRSVCVSLQHLSCTNVTRPAA